MTQPKSIELQFSSGDPGPGYPHPATAETGSSPMEMNLKKDEKLQSGGLGPLPNSLADMDPITHTLLYLSLFPLFCLRALQCMAQAAVQLYSTYSNKIPPCTGAITCPIHNISKSPYLPTLSIFLPRCHHVRSHKRKFLRESGNSSYQIITEPRCASDQIHLNLLGAQQPPLHRIPYPSQISCPEGGS